MNDKKLLINLLGAAFLLLNIQLVQGQINIRPSSGSGSGYQSILNKDFALETPDCGHSGPHITQSYDSQLRKNVFNFLSHINADDDRCRNDDRVRIETRAVRNARDFRNGVSHYRWKFRIDGNFKTSNRFCHLFQLKALGGNNDDFPILTVSAIRDKMELKYNGNNNGPDTRVLNEAPLRNFEAVWVEGYIRIEHKNNGSVYFTLKKVNTGEILLAYDGGNLDLWREGASHNNAKWGVYRGKASNLTFESVKFADFCLSKSSANQCPSSVPNDKRLEGKTFTMQNRRSRDFLDSDPQGGLKTRNANGNNDQKWRFVKASGDYYNIDNVQGGRGVLDSQPNNDRVVWSSKQPRTNDIDKRWIVEVLGNNTYRFRNGVESRFYLSEDQNSGRVEYDRFNGTKSQWILRRANRSQDSEPETTSTTSARTSLDEELSIYPNPATSQVTIRAKDSQKTYELAIFNLNGQQVFKNDTFQNTLNLQTSGIFSKGVYFLTFTNKEEILTQKLIIN